MTIEPTILSEIRKKKIKFNMISIVTDINAETLVKKHSAGLEMCYHKEMSIFMGKVLLKLLESNENLVYEIEGLARTKPDQEIREILLERYFKLELKI